MDKRSHYFIDKQFQAKFILKFCLINIAASLLIGLLIYFLNRQTNTVAFENLRVVVKSTADFIQPIVLMVIVIVTLFTALSTIIVVLLASHRIAGPLYRLTLELEKIKAKDLSHPIRIRASDQLQKLGSECEAVRVEYQRLIHQAKKSWQSIRAFLQQSKNSVNNAQEKRQLEQDMDILTTEFEQFKTQ